ncbi:hypothetical protein [Oceanicoccus sagamiensis]|uniref:hypothetical protein n=1 Tax=Oceanicoccus sagamiensis TaxID=716816 RepID=UPI0012F4DB90|nr:hypothetical protein [Oceanicoccus sagamiensis]
MAVFCDSIGFSHGKVTGWPEHLKTLIDDKVWHDCRPSWTLQDYNVEQTIIDSGLANNYQYGVLALGFNDLFHGAFLGDVLDLYESTLDIIAFHGLEPVCMTYSYNTVFTTLANPLNEGIVFICEQRGLKIIANTDRLLDGLHPDNLGSMEIAENAWRVLY